MKQRAITVMNAFAVFAALLMLWQIVLWIFHVPPYMLPAPWAVAKSVAARFPSLVNALAITNANRNSSRVDNLAMQIDTTGLGLPAGIYTGVMTIQAQAI